MKGSMKALGIKRRAQVGEDSKGSRDGEAMSTVPKSLSGVALRDQPVKLLTSRPQAAQDLQVSAEAQARG